MLKIQAGPVDPQPFLALPVFRQHLVHFIPEGVGMVLAMEVAQLVDHDVVDDRQRRHQAFPVECQMSRSEEHTSELQSLMRISYAVFCLKKKNHKQTLTTNTFNTQTHSRI